MAISVPEYPAKDRLPPPKCLTPEEGGCWRLHPSMEKQRGFHIALREVARDGPAVSFHTTLISSALRAARQGPGAFQLNQNFNTSKCVPFFAGEPFQKCSGLNIMKLVSYQLSDLR